MKSHELDEEKTADLIKFEKEIGKVKDDVLAESNEKFEKQTDILKDIKERPRCRTSWQDVNPTSREFTRNQWETNATKTPFSEGLEWETKSPN